MDSVIQASQEGRILTIEVNRPQQLNALNSEVLRQIRDVIQAAQTDPSLGSIVIVGAGDRAFSAGADLHEIDGLDVEQASEFIKAGHQTMDTIASSGVPVIAQVDGFALGGGFEMMLACHVVVASHRSQFGLPEARIGCIPGFGGTQRLVLCVGKPAAMHLMLTGERIDAERAWQIGLLSIPPLGPAQLPEHVRQLAALIASGSRPGIGRILDAARSAAPPRALAHEASLAAIAIAAPDGQEGIASFRERRPPAFGKEKG